MNHPLHELIGKKIKDLQFGNEIKIVADQACGGNQSIPIFCSSIKSNDTEFTNPDLIIIKENKIKIIIEIEESNIKPVQIFGKFLSSALGKYYIRGNENNELFPKDSETVFIQILDSKKLQPESKKIIQGKRIEESINGILPDEIFSISKYKLFYYKDEEIDNIISYIKNNV